MKRKRGKVPDGYLDWNQMIRGCDTANPPTTAEMTFGESFVNVFTSGTTGLPKASPALQSKWVSSGKVFGKVMLQPTEKDTVYVPLPLQYGTNSADEPERRPKNGSVKFRNRLFYPRT